MLKQTHVTGLFVNAFSVSNGRRAFPGAGFGIRMEFWSGGVLQSTAVSDGKMEGFLVDDRETASESCVAGKI